LPLFHQVRVTLTLLLDELELVLDVLLLLLLHAAIATAVATATATMTGLGEPRMRLSSPDDAEDFLWPGLLLGGPPGAAESGGRASGMTSVCHDPKV
jgi:hypothetical protein